MDNESTNKEPSLIGRILVIISIGVFFYLLWNLFGLVFLNGFGHALDKEIEKNQREKVEEIIEERNFLIEDIEETYEINIDETDLPSLVRYETTEDALIILEEAEDASRESAVSRIEQTVRQDIDTLNDMEVSLREKVK